MRVGVMMHPLILLLIVAGLVWWVHSKRKGYPGA